MPCLPGQCCISTNCFRHFLQHGNICKCFLQKRAKFNSKCAGLFWHNWSAASKQSRFGTHFFHLLNSKFPTCKPRELSLTGVASYCGPVRLLPADWKFKGDSKFIFQRRMVTEKMQRLPCLVSFLDTKTLLGFLYSIMFPFKTDTK